MLLVGDVNLGNRLGRLVLQRNPGGAVERSARRIDVDVGVDRGDFGLREELILLEIAFIPGLDIATILGRQVFIQHVGVVKVPRTGANGEQQENDRCWSKTGSSAEGETGPRRQGVFRSAPSVSDGGYCQYRKD